MKEPHAPSPVTYNLRKSLRDQLPSSDEYSLFDEMEGELFRDPVNEMRQRRRGAMEKLGPIDAFLGISFRYKANGVLISTKPIYFSSDDAVYETYIGKENEKPLDVVVHGTDPDVQPSAVRKAKNIHDRAVTLAKQGFGIRAIRDAVVSMLS